MWFFHPFCFDGPPCAPLMAQLLAWKTEVGAWRVFNFVNTFRSNVITFDSVYSAKDCTSASLNDIHFSNLMVTKLVAELNRVRTPGLLQRLPLSPVPQLESPRALSRPWSPARIWQFLCSLPLKNGVLMSVLRPDWAWDLIHVILTVLRTDKSLDTHL